MPRTLPTAASRPQLDPQLGTPVFVRYMDHVLFRDSDPSKQFPWTRECVGWLDYQDEEKIRVVWERSAVPDPPKDARQVATGIVILRKNIVELLRL